MSDRSTMDLLYLSNERIPGPSAGSIQQINMCAAFAQAGLTVTLVRPWYWSMRRSNSSELGNFYGTSASFSVVTLPTFLSLSRPEKKDRLRIPLLGGVSMMVAMGLYLLYYVLTTTSKRTLVIYGRNVNAAVVCLWLRKRVLHKRTIRIIFEAHSLAQQPEKLFRYVLHHCDQVIAISQALQQELVRDERIAADIISPVPDGVRREQCVEPPYSTQEAQAMIGVPRHFKKVVVYTGSFKPGKGVQVFLQAAGMAPEDLYFLVVGGTWLEQESMKGKGANVHCTGFVPPSRIPLYQRAADILVLPNVAEGSIHRYTSPLKLFEYMAAKKPIIAGDLPVLREVLRDGDNAMLVPPGDAGALIDAIIRLLKDNELAGRIATNAHDQVWQYTWEQRVEKISNLIILCKKNQTSC
jgi:glycosyltransferase involved in cell wall biosynthesis